MPAINNIALLKEMCLLDPLYSATIKKIWSRAKLCSNLPLPYLKIAAFY